MRVRAGHPWVFRDALGARGVSEQTGMTVDLIAGNREFVARGYVDREHAVAVRVAEPRSERERRPRQRRDRGAFQRAVQLRWPARRRPPGGDADVLGRERRPARRHRRSVRRLRRRSVAVGRRARLARRALRRDRETLSPRGIYEQRRLRPLGGSAPPEPAVRARGDEAPLELVVEDAGCRFGVDVTAPLGSGCSRTCGSAGPPSRRAPPTVGC